MNPARHHRSVPRIDMQQLAFIFRSSKQTNRLGDDTISASAKYAQICHEPQQMASNFRCEGVHQQPGTCIVDRSKKLLYVSSNTYYYYLLRYLDMLKYSSSSAIKAAGLPCLPARDNPCLPLFYTLHVPPLFAFSVLWSHPISL